MDEAKQHQEILKGFNAGYFLEKYKTRLAAKLRQGMSDKSTPFMVGMLKGAEQFKDESFFDAPPPNIPSNIKKLDLDNPEIGFQKGRDDFGIEV